MKRFKKIFSLVLFGMLLTSCSPSQTSHLGYREISVEKAKELMKTEKNYIILDVRTPEEYAESHIPGAINVANEEIGSEEIPELPDKNQLILVYCRSGRRSKEAAKKLVALGYTNVVEFGGILDWTGDLEKG